MDWPKLLENSLPEKEMTTALIKEVRSDFSKYRDKFVFFVLERNGDVVFCKEHKEFADRKAMYCFYDQYVLRKQNTLSIETRENKISVVLDTNLFFIEEVIEANFSYTRMYIDFVKEPDLPMKELTEEEIRLGVLELMGLVSVLPGSKKAV